MTPFFGCLHLRLARGWRTLPTSITHIASRCFGSPATAASPSTPVTPTASARSTAALAQAPPDLAPAEP
jgi:hypothetical protein